MASHKDLRRALVVANPIAGRGRGKRQAELLAAGLRDLGLETELYLTSARGDGGEKVRGATAAESVDLVVSVGGDGTLGEIVGGLHGASVHVAALPMGTANVLALDLKLPRTVDGLLALIEDGGRPVEVDVALVNSRPSFLVTGVGFDGTLVRALDLARKGPITRMSYLKHGVSAFLGYSAPELRVRIDDQALEGTFGMVLISNIVHYAGFRCMAADRQLNDGRYEAYLFRNARRPALAAHFARALTLGWPGGSVERVQGRRFVVESDAPVPYQVDGDYGGETPVELEVSSTPFTILAPKP